MKRILVPCDFSKPSINAFRFALSVAEQYGEISLVNVIELPVLVDPILIPNIGIATPGVTKSTLDPNLAVAEIAL